MRGARRGEASVTKCNGADRVVPHVGYNLNQKLQVGHALLLKLLWVLTQLWGQWTKHLGHMHVKGLL